MKCYLFNVHRIKFDAEFEAYFVNNQIFFVAPHLGTHHTEPLQWARHLDRSGERGDPGHLVPRQSACGLWRQGVDIPDWGCKGE